ncbi:MAG: TetR/AcrR family transcriptional regulator [Clostridiales bacterium]|nr:TetR/AcrR family transcriptional regulator [Clostridiales bacterium]
MARTRRQEELYAVAAELFRTKGYHGTSIQDLAEALGIQRGSLYAHIERKEELLYGITLEAAQAFLSALEPLQEASGSPLEKLERAFVAHARVVADHLPAASVFFHEWQHLHGEAREEILSLRHRYEELWRRLVKDAFPRADERLAVRWILGGLNWMYQWYRPEGALSPEDLARRFYRYATEGIGGMVHG